MKTKIYLILIIQLINSNLNAQIDTTKVLDIAFQKMNLISKATIEGDYEKVIDYTHPKIVEMTGGRENLLTTIKQIFEGDLKIESYKSEIPEELIITDSTYQCAIKSRMDLNISGNTYYIIGYTIGVSYDTGESWTFISVSGNTLEGLKPYFPELSNDLKVESQTLPVLIKD